MEVDHSTQNQQSIPSSTPTSNNYSPLGSSVAEMLANRHQEIIEKQPLDSEKKHGAGLWSIISILMFIIGVGGILFGAYTLYQLRITETELKVREIELKRLQQEQVKGNTIVVSQMPVSVTPLPTVVYNNNQIPQGYVAKQTTCYTIYIPRDNTAGDENNCELIYEASIGENTDLGASIQTEYKKFTSLQEMVQDSTNNFTNSFQSEGPTKVGNIDAEKITERLADDTKIIHVYVFIPDKYKVGGLMASGFEITKSLNEDEEPRQRQVLDILLATWKWK